MDFAQADSRCKDAERANKYKDLHVRVSCMSCPIYVTITILPKQNKLASITFLYKTLLGRWHAEEQQAGLEPDSAGFPTALVIFK